MCFAAIGLALGATEATAAMMGFSAVTSVAGLGFQAYSSMQQSAAAQDSADYNAAVQRNNAQLAEYQAQDAVTRGDKATEDHMRKVAQLKGSQKASMAARGLDLSEGSALNILTDTDLFGEIDANTIQTNAAREAWGYRAQGSNSTAQANLYKMQADNQNPLMAGAGTLLAGAGSVADRWTAYKKAS